MIRPRLRLQGPAQEAALLAGARRAGLYLSPLHIALLREGELGLRLGPCVALLQGYADALEAELRAARALGDRRSIIQGIEAGIIRYRRADPDEEWQLWGDTLERGGGDCEDLAAAVAAELRVDGPPAGWAARRTAPGARPVVYRARPGLLHVVTLAPWGVIDPSRLAGMGRE